MNASERLLPPARGVALRLYRQGLGDSFLLAFPRAGTPEAADPEPFYLLIDCGVILGTSEPKTPMTAVALDIAAATAGRIDLLVITHEHWDHLSGFLQAEEVWKSIHIEAVWMAWTENLAIGLAKRLKEDFRNDLDALRLALDRSGEDARHIAALTGLVGLFGDPVELMAAAKAGRRFSELTHDALKKVRELAGDRVDYREPGEVLTLPGVPGVRFYVLGPPQNERVLRNIKPSKRRPQTYTESRRPLLSGPRPTEKAAFTLALRGCAAPALAFQPLTDREKDVFRRCFPFDQHLQISFPEAARDKFFREHYGFPESEPGAASPPVPAAPGPAHPGPSMASPPPGPEWRRINEDWLGSWQSVAKRKPARKTPREGKLKALLQPAPEAAPEPELRFPFDRHLRVGLDEAARMPFFWEHYGFEGPAPVVPASQAVPAASAPEPANGPEWRRVDTDWLGIAGELALQMDSYTNNTSLALAIELVDSGKVLLFPADAQVGNWLSWDEIDPPFKGADGRPVTAADLLRRTVFYKVGHHGSHNATMRDAGLERMVSPDLIAFVPVDERVAHEVRHWMEMPFGPLLARLYEKARGRVIRLDHGVVTDGRPDFLPEDVWERIAPTARKFEQEAVQTGGRLPQPDGKAEKPLYYQLVITDAPREEAR
jgi:glyoxylase-like metal-dependent hydrolase (beta-lactamase superfamily II)